MGEIRCRMIAKGMCSNLCSCFGPLELSHCDAQPQASPGGLSGKPHYCAIYNSVIGAGTLDPIEVLQKAKIMLKTRDVIKLSTRE